MSKRTTRGGRQGKRRPSFLSVDRRDFLKITGAAGVSASLPLTTWLKRARADVLAAGLSDPAIQPKFSNDQLVPNALNPGFIYDTRKNKIKVAVGASVQMTGLVETLPAPGGGTMAGAPVSTTVWGYGDKGVYTWPGRSFEVQSGVPLEVKWENRLIDELGDPLPMPVTSFGRSVIDTSLHWAYSLHGYEEFTTAANGVPIVPHVHGGHTDDIFDGNPEYFFSPGWEVRGPKWVEKKYIYDNSQPAGTVWYHDHALGITRLNVYAGMAGFFIIRDEIDTGQPNNPLGLPAYPYEAAFAIQDRMFHADGGLFYPAFPDDPFYEDFITGEGAELPDTQFPGGGPTGLAEFFGDHMLVNGIIWPKMDVEPRNYRLRFLNGCDSRFLVVRFRETASTSATTLDGAGAPIPFKVIGSDQGLASSATTVTSLVMETGSRYDLIFDFSGLQGKRIIMENIGGDSPFGFTFGDDLEPEDVFDNRQTDRVMAFDVGGGSSIMDAFNPALINQYAGNPNMVDRVRKVALFEGTDEYGRLQPLLGTAEPATDYMGNPINWPNTPEYVDAGLIGQMEGAIAWHSPTTENPSLGATEEWHIANVTGDAHPVHLHLVHFEIVSRHAIVWDTATNEEDRVLDPNGVATPQPNGDGTYLVDQPVVQHNGLLGSGFRVVNLTYDLNTTVDPNDGAPGPYVENAPKDMVSALPGQVTVIRATFDKPGRYVWHCHILSHEDHEMMRVMHVGPGA